MGMFGPLKFLRAQYTFSPKICFRNGGEALLSGWCWNCFRFLQQIDELVDLDDSSVPIDGY